MIVNKLHLNRYNNFIESRKLREIPEGMYTEKHHITPRSLGGSDDSINLIILTGREHFLAHLMLWKVYGGKMAQAFFFMTSNKRKHSGRITSKQYEKIRIDYSNYQRDKRQGKTYEELFGNEKAKQFKDQLSISLTGIKRTQAQKDAVSKLRKGKPSGREGTHLTDDHKRKISACNVGLRKGKTIDEIYGNEKAEHTKQKMSDARKAYWKNHKSPRKGKTMVEIYGVKRAQEIKDKMRESLKLSRSKEKIA